MSSYRNQKRIIIQKELTNKENYYTTINLDALQRAMNNLKGETLKLWLYLSKNQNNYHLELSQKSCEEWGIKKDAYYAAVKTLIRLNYLDQWGPDSRKYTFHEIPTDISVYFHEEQNAANNPESLSQNQKDNSGIHNPFSQNQNQISEKPRRNNTNNINIIKENTNNTKRSSLDYLEEEILGDGYINKKGYWIDYKFDDYWESTKEEQIRMWMHEGYSEAESIYIVEKIITD